MSEQQFAVSVGDTIEAEIRVGRYSTPRRAVCIVTQVTRFDGRTGGEHAYGLHMTQDGRWSRNERHLWPPWIAVKRRPPLEPSLIRAWLLGEAQERQGEADGAGVDGDEDDRLYWWEQAERFREAAHLVAIIERLAEEGAIDADALTYRPIPPT